MATFLERLRRRALRLPPEAPRQDWNAEPSDDAFVELCFRLILGRIPTGFERREHVRALEGGASRTDIRRAFLRSPEFLLRRRDWMTKLPPPASADPALDPLGPDARFVELCYEILLGRPADGGGRDFYVDHLRDGQPRGWVVRSLASSKELSDDLAGLSDTGAPPVDVQLCELANPAKWDNPEWMDLLLSYGVIAGHKEAMHRKGYEFTQLIFGLKALGALRGDASVLSVGAGHEAPAFWLSNHVRHVVATDLYAGEWQSVGAREGDAAVLARPEDFAPFGYRRDRLTFLRMDGCHLAFHDAAFDVAYSLSSIEHFGGVAGASAAVREMARVVRPGGLVAIATDWCVDGPPAEDGFTPADVRQIIDVPNLSLVQPIDDRVWSRYRAAIVDVRKTPLKTPHMLLREGDTVFTSVMMFLRRD